MSSQEDAEGGKVDRSGREALAHLEEAVGDLLELVDELRDRVKRSERRTKALEEELARFVEGGAKPRDMVDRLTALEDRNEDLAERLNEGRAGVERLLARIRFLEEQAS